MVLVTGTALRLARTGIVVAPSVDGPRPPQGTALHIADWKSRIHSAPWHPLPSAGSGGRAPIRGHAGGTSHSGQEEGPWWPSIARIRQSVRKRAQPHAV